MLIIDATLIDDDLLAVKVDEVWIISMPIIQKQLILLRPTDFPTLSRVSQPLTKAYGFKALWSALLWLQSLNLNMREGILSQVGGFPLVQQSSLRNFQPLSHSYQQEWLCCGEGEGATKDRGVGVTFSTNSDPPFPLLLNSHPFIP